MENEDTKFHMESILDQGSTLTDWKGETFYFPFELCFEVAQTSGILIIYFATLMPNYAIFHHLTVLFTTLNAADRKSKDQMAKRYCSCITWCFWIPQLQPSSFPASSLSKLLHLSVCFSTYKGWKIRVTYLPPKEWNR